MAELVDASRQNLIFSGRGLASSYARLAVFAHAHNVLFPAEVAELVDALDSKSSLAYPR